MAIDDCLNNSEEEIVIKWLQAAKNVILTIGINISALNCIEVENL